MCDIAKLRSRLTRRNVDFDEIVFIFPVLYAGWEMDEEAALLRKDDKYFLYTTDHGSAKINDIDFLEAKLAEYNNVAGLTKKALDTIRRNNE